MVEQPESLRSSVSLGPGLEGTAQYRATPYVTAGDRLYLVGHQDGSFPDLGWHVKGEMGGIWDHPIKLMDGFAESLSFNDSIFCLPEATSFTNYPYANLLRYPEQLGISIERFHFVPDGMEGMVVEYAFSNTTEETQSFTFTFTGMVDLRPVWLGERTNMNDAKDSLWAWEEHQAIMAKDLGNEWYVLFGSLVPPVEYPLENLSCTFERLGLGASGSLSYDIILDAGESMYVPITIAGSYSSRTEALNTFQEIRDNMKTLIKEKDERYAGIYSTSELDIPDSSLAEAFHWIKYNTDWLVRDVEGVGRGLAAGIPDYPWWFGADSEYALQGAVMTGQWELVYETIQLLTDISDSVNSNGRIVHEVSSNGAVFNPGNINETPQFASLIWKVYNWTGNREFLEKYYPVVVQGMEWLMTERDSDGNGLPDGFGMMEIHGLDSEMIDVAAYTQKAFADASQMATVLGEMDQAASYQQQADALAKKINTEFWVEEQQSYADFIGTVAQAKTLIGHAIHRADSLGKPWAVKELENTLESLESYPGTEKRAFVVHHNWVVNTPLETGVAEKEKALKALETAQRFTNPFGMYVTGIDRDENAGDDVGSFVTNKKIFTYIGAVMTLPTGVQAVAENNYGRPDQALDYLTRMTRSFSFALPGSMYEVSPDYGMIVQAWNIYAFAVPLVEQFFGIRPRAHDNIIGIRPLMPTAWENASISRVRVLDGYLTLTYSRMADGIQMEAYYDGTARLEFSVGDDYENWKVDDEDVTPETMGGTKFFRLSPGSYTLTFTN